MRIVHRADRCSRLIGVNVRCRVVFVVNLDLALQVCRNYQFDLVFSAVILEGFCVVPVLNIVNRNCGLMDGHTNVERKLGIVLAVSRDKLCRECSSVRLRCAVVNGRVADVFVRIYPFEVAVDRRFAYITGNDYRAAGEAEVAELHAIVRIGRSAGSQKHCEGILASSRRSHDCLISGYAINRNSFYDIGCQAFAAVDRISQLLRGVNDIVLISFQSDLDGVGRVCLELISGPKTIAIGIIAAIAHPQAGGRRVDIQIKGFLALDEVGDRYHGIGDRSRNDGHNDLVGGCRLMVVIRRTDGPEGIGTDVQLCRCTVVYCTGTLVRCFIVDHDIRRITPADGDTVAIGERDGVAVRNRNCVFLVVDLQRQFAGGFCDLKGLFGRTGILGSSSGDNHLGLCRNVGVIVIGQRIIRVLYKLLPVQADRRFGLDLFAGVFEGADIFNGSTADIGGTHSQNAGRFRSEAADRDRDALAIVFSDCQFGVLCRVSRVHAGAKLNRIAACVLRGNDKACQVQLIAAVVAHVGFVCDRNAGHGIRLYCDRDIAGIAVIAGRDDIFAFHKASGRKRDGDAANRSRIAVFVDVFTDKVFCDLRRSGGGEEVRRTILDAGSKCGAFNNSEVLFVDIENHVGFRAEVEKCLQFIFCNSLFCFENRLKEVASRNELSSVGSDSRCGCKRNRKQAVSIVVWNKGSLIFVKNTIYSGLSRIRDIDRFGVISHRDGCARNRAIFVRRIIEKSQSDTIGLSCFKRLYRSSSGFVVFIVLKVFPAQMNFFILCAGNNRARKYV